MPDRLDLDDRLARSRADLLGGIDQPPLAAVRQRAAALRRRRHTAVTGAALAVLVTAGLVAVRPWAAPDPGPAPAATPNPSAPVYSGDGLIINGLVPGMLLDLPGGVADAEFADPDRGIVAVDCGGAPRCTPTVAVTADGGLTWTTGTLPADLPGAPEVVAFPRGALLVQAAGVTYASPDGGRTWQATPGPGRGGPPAAATAEQILRLDGDRVLVWDPVRGPVGALPDQATGLQVRWVAARSAGDGAWWAGGAQDGRAAVTVTRDRGATWATTVLPGTPTGVDNVRVATLGRQVFALATGAGGAPIGVWHSEDGGATFHRTYAVGHDGPRAVEGDPVPLLDGRLLVAEPPEAGNTTGGRLWLSDDRGTTFRPAGRALPAVGALAATASGFVAYGLFAGTWTAYSADGSTWRKLQIN